MTETLIHLAKEIVDAGEHPWQYQGIVLRKWEKLTVVYRLFSFKAEKAEDIYPIAYAIQGTGRYAQEE